MRSPHIIEVLIPGMLLTTLSKILNRLPRGAGKLRLTLLNGTLCSVAVAPGALVNDLCSGAGDPALPQLVDAVRQSLSAQPQLVVAQQDVIESRADVTAAVAPFLPMVTASLRSS